MDGIEKYAEQQAYKIAARIDKGIAVVLKPKPSYCPQWLYNKIIKNVVEIVHIQ